MKGFRSLDGITGDILSQEYDELDSYSGTVRVGVLNPYEACVGPTGCSGSKICTAGTQVNCHPMPYSAIYEDAGAYQNVDECVNIFTGYYPRYLGQTDYHGYFSLTPSDPSDTSWIIDRNKAALDIDPSPPSITEWTLDDTSVDGGYDNTSSCNFMTGFSASSPYVSYTNTVGDFLGFRNEMAYHFTYGANFFTSVVYDTPIPEPVRFNYTRSSGTDCVCGGLTSGTFINIWCGSAFENLSSCPNMWQIVFRDSIYHEYGHAVHNTIGTTIESGCYHEDGVYKEAVSTFTAMLLSSCESGGNPGSYLGANRIWPSTTYDYSANYYTRATAFSAIWLEYLLEEGNFAALAVYRHLLDLDESTKMIGSCSNAYDFSNGCPENTFYAHLANRAGAEWAVHSKQLYEVSRAFHKHISGRYYADTSEPVFNNNCTAGWIHNSGSDSLVFPYADDATDQGWRAAVIPLDSPLSSSSTSSVYPVISRVQDEYLDQKPWFSNIDDYDKYMFFGRAGETYYIYTTNLSTSTDTVLDVVNETGSTVLQCNPRGSDPCDDCNANTLASCTTFSAPSTGFYTIYVHAYAGSRVGYQATYEIAVEQVNDDYADTQAPANPLPIDGSLRPGYINSASDQDWTYFILKAQATVNFALCGSTPSMMVIYDSTGNAEQMIFSTASCNTIYQYDFSAGQHFVEILGGGSTGAYNFLVSANQDLDSDSAASSFDLGVGLALAPGPHSRLKMIPTALEDSGDVDWYKVSLDRGAIFQAFTQDLGEGVDTVMDVYAPSSTFYNAQGSTGPLSSSYSMVLLRDDNGGAYPDHASRVEFVAPASATYYIKVYSKSGGAAGRYTASFYVFPGTGPQPTLP